MFQRTQPHAPVQVHINKNNKHVKGRSYNQPRDELVVEYCMYRHTCPRFKQLRTAVLRHLTVALPIPTICVVQYCLFVPKGSMKRGQI